MGVIQIPVIQPIGYETEDAKQQDIEGTFQKPALAPDYAQPFPKPKQQSAFDLSPQPIEGQYGFPPPKPTVISISELRRRIHDFVFGMKKQN